MRNIMKKRWGLTVSLVIYVFLVMLVALLIAGLLVMILHLTGLLAFWEGVRPEYVNCGTPFRVILSMTVFSIMMGTAIAWFFSKKALKPIRKIIDATRKVAAGDFSVKVGIRGIHELEELSQSFNIMAQELSNTEALRRDFINDFSHEFKTPIVSVRGFAKLLKDGSLSEKDRQEYLDIIITESERLAALSTNVLNLTKYENLEIITDKAEYRLDEQIRRAVVLTEPKWTAKGIEVVLEMDEVLFTGNSDLTQQIWLNLLDNAIKFSNLNGIITIWLTCREGGIRFTIRDNGVGMDDLTKARVFDKFYQGDESRSKSGNGLGLTIVKRIIDLCGGRVEIRGELGVGSEFVVWLPTDV